MSDNTGNAETKKGDHASTNHADLEGVISKQQGDSQSIKKAGQPVQQIEEKPAEAMCVGRSNNSNSNNKNSNKRAKPPQKDPHLPVKPLSAYNLFFRDERVKLLQEWAQKPKIGSADSKAEAKQNEGKKGSPLFRMMGQEIGRRWQSLDAERKARYQSIAKDDQDRYRAEKAAWKRKRRSLKQDEGEDDDDDDGHDDYHVGSGATERDTFTAPVAKRRSVEKSVLKRIEEKHKTNMDDSACRRRSNSMMLTQNPGASQETSESAAALRVNPPPPLAEPAAHSAAGTWGGRSSVAVAAGTEGAASMYHPPHRQQQELLLLSHLQQIQHLQQNDATISRSNPDIPLQGFAAGNQHPLRESYLHAASPSMNQVFTSHSGIQGHTTTAIGGNRSNDANQYYHHPALLDGIARQQVPGQMEPMLCQALLNRNLHVNLAAANAGLLQQYGLSASGGDSAATRDSRHPLPGFNPSNSDSSINNVQHIFSNMYAQVEQQEERLRSAAAASLLSSFPSNQAAFRDDPESSISELSASELIQFLLLLGQR